MTNEMEMDPVERLMGILDGMDGDKVLDMLKTMHDDGNLEIDALLMLARYKGQLEGMTQAQEFFKPEWSAEASEGDAS